MKAEHQEEGYPYFIGVAGEPSYHIAASILFSIIPICSQFTSYEP